VDHGVGECNCWNLSLLKITVTSQLPFVIADGQNFDGSKVCHSEHGNGGVFCNGAVYEVRGLVTNAVALSGNQSVDNCPGNSNSSLFPNMQSALPINCDTTSPKM